MTRFTPSGTGLFRLAQSRIGSTGQGANLTLNDCDYPPSPPLRCENFSAERGQTTPWIYSVNRVSTEGILDPTNPQTQIFPTHWAYVVDESSHGVHRLVSVKTQASPAQIFIDFDSDNSAIDPDDID